MKPSMSRVTRRSAVGLLGLVGASAIGAAAAPAVPPPGAIALAAAADHQHDGAAPAAAQDQDGPTTDEMDAMREAGVKAFPAQTKGLGGQPLPFTQDGNVKVFDLVCEVVPDWEFMPGKTVEAWTYNGVVPGPELRVTEGDTVRVDVSNELPESTAVHWHGLMVPNSQDGVPFITQPPIEPGERFTYEFTIREGNAGSHLYHSHHNAAAQVTKGLLGPFIVEPKDPTTRPAFDREYTLVLNDGPRSRAIPWHNGPCSVRKRGGAVCRQEV